MKVITPYNRHEFKGPRCRKIEGFSVTIPEQSMSIKEIYERYNQGIPLDLEEQRGIFDNLTLDDFDVTDTTEVLSMADLYNKMSDIQKRALLEKKLTPKPQEPAPPQPVPTDPNPSNPEPTSK